MESNQAFNHPSDLYADIIAGYALMFPQETKSVLEQHSDSESSNKELASQILSEALSKPAKG